MRSIFWELVEFALGWDVTHGDHEFCNKMKPCSILWAIFSNSTSCIFQSMRLKLLVNMYHYTFCCKHIVVPSVASGKYVKLRSPFICCSVVERLFCECELKNFEALHSRFLKVSQLWIMYSVTSAFSQCGLNSSGVNSETSLVYCLKSNGHTNFSKSLGATSKL
jgi:hypothetical protein